MQWTVAIGVDTHKDVHVAVALDGFGEQLGSHEVETTEAGYRSLLSWALGLGQPVFAVEGAGSYGAGLVRFLGCACVWARSRASDSPERRPCFGPAQMSSPVSCAGSVVASSDSPKRWSRSS